LLGFDMYCVQKCEMGFGPALCDVVQSKFEKMNNRWQSNI